MKHLVILFAIVLIAVGAYTFTQSQREVATSLNFIGMATGSLATDVNDLNFQNLFSVEDHELVGVASFDSVPEGSIVQATWFSPDDRRIPLGRKEIVTQSGAKVAKFSIANSATWEPAPYMLDIYVYSPDRSKATASGSTHFFMGMETEAIQTYMEEYQTYKRLELEEQWKRTGEQEEEQAILAEISKAWYSKDAGIALRQDISGDGSRELFITDPTIDPNAPFSGNNLITTDINNFGIYDKSGSGSMMLLVESGKNEKIVHLDGVTLDNPIPSDDPIKLSIPSESTVRLEWTEGEDVCAWNFRYEEGAFVTTDRGCAIVSEEESQEEEEPGVIQE